MKVDFRNLNIHPTPNPKPLRVLRVPVRVPDADGNMVSGGDGLVINANVDPHRALREIDNVLPIIASVFCGRR